MKSMYGFLRKHKAKQNCCNSFYAIIAGAIANLYLNGVYLFNDI